MCVKQQHGSICFNKYFAAVETCFSVVKVMLTLEVIPILNIGAFHCRESLNHLSQA